MAYDLEILILVILAKIFDNYSCFAFLSKALRPGLFSVRRELALLRYCHFLQYDFLKKSNAHYIEAVPDVRRRMSPACMSSVVWL